MNRREVLAGIAAIPGLATIGAVRIADCEDANMPLFAVIECDSALSDEAICRMREGWHLAFDGKPPFPVIILQDCRMKLCQMNLEGK